MIRQYSCDLGFARIADVVCCSLIHLQPASDSKSKGGLPIRKFLEQVGYEVSEAWSGRSAMAQITDVRPPEILITDLKMLDGSGYWLLDQIEEYYPSLLRRTVIVTGDTRREEALDVSLRTGCPLLAKPFDLPVLLELLEGLPPGDRSGR